jgi:hypothetical protein
MPRHLYKTKVARICGFWKVQRLFCGQWETMPDMFCTRLEARNARHYWAQR